MHREQDCSRIHAVTIASVLDDDLAVVVLDDLSADCESNATPWVLFTLLRLDHLIE